MAAGRVCFHCKEWIEAGSAHDCWTTTETALTKHLPDDLRDAWERLRETATEFGDQRIYASHRSIMFSRKACYFFVRPRRSWLEVWIFLGRTLRAPQVRRVESGSSVKFCHLIRIRHRDEVEAPLTDWLREAYDVSDELTATRRSRPTPDAKSPAGKAIGKKTSAKETTAKKTAAKKTAGKRARRSATGPRVSA